MARLPLPRNTFVRRYVVVMMVLTTAAILASLALRSSVRARSQSLDLPVLGSIDGFRLISQSGSEFSSEELAGRAYVADFIFTSCAGVCPTMTASMGQLYREFSGEDALRFVSISVDPETDTPERLSAYAADHGAAPDRWVFLTGDIDGIQSLAHDQFKLGSADEPINHSPRFVLVDGVGDIRGYYDGTDPESVAVLQGDLRRLLAEMAAIR